MPTLDRKAWSAIHDDPVAKMKAASAEAYSKSPHARLMKNHVDEVRELGQKHIRESRELEGKHRLKRGAEYQFDRPRPYRFEEKMESERKALNARHAEESSALKQRQRKELSELKD